MSRGRAWTAALVILLVVLAIGAVAGGLIDVPAPTATPHAASPVAGGGDATGAGLALIDRADLPAEARATLDLVVAGGPFPYPADGGTFENRERRLPLRPGGTYREYTVATPGSADRGARRIVVDATGESYWTPDHYATFFRIRP